MKTRKYQNFRACGGLTQTILTFITKNFFNLHFLIKSPRSGENFLGVFLWLNSPRSGENFFGLFFLPWPKSKKNNTDVYEQRRINGFL